MNRTKTSKLLFIKYQKSKKKKTQNIYYSATTIWLTKFCNIQQQDLPIEIKHFIY